MSAYYNEIDPQKAACLREFIKANLIAPGEVDERSIADVAASDLRGFTQCHFFAGFGVWSYALRLAGWDDDRPVWTGSCPCPSFSAAGKGEGFDDPRHLWPAWARHVRVCKPATIFGEQADDAIGYGWLDLVQTDLERENYAVGKAVLGACSVGAPHIRQRLYFCAHAEHSERWTEREIDGNTYGRDGFGRSNDACGCWDQNAWHKIYGLRPGEICGNLGKRSNSDGRLPSNGNLQRGGEQRLLAEDGGTGECADALRERGQQERGSASGDEAADGRTRRDSLESDGDNELAGDGETFSSSDSSQRGQPMRGSAPGNGGHTTQSNESLFGSQPLSERLERHFGDVRDWRGPGWLDPATARSVAKAGATRGFWADCDWWHARDEKYRPIEPGLFPLAHGASHRVLKLRGYGDAIVPQVAAEFIAANLDIYV